jgi:hypothetical protein
LFLRDLKFSAAVLEAELKKEEEEEEEEGKKKTLPCQHVNSFQS